MLKDLRWIKKHYGEALSHYCRDNFSSLLEIEGKLPEILKDNFIYSKTLYKDIMKSECNQETFRDFILSFNEPNLERVTTNKTPFELMDKAGYQLFECKTKEQIDRFKEYYDIETDLCTFDDPDRLKRRYVFFAVKKDVFLIYKEDYPEPKREDDYSTSVLSIQFTKGKTNLVSIISRYNHLVMNSDATYSNELDRIIPGLTYSFEKMLNLNLKTISVNNPPCGYILANDGKFYSTNFSHNNILYGPNNVIINDYKIEEKYLNKSRYLVIDYFIIDLQKKHIFLYDDELNDSFVDDFMDIDKIEIIKQDNNNKLIKIYINNVVVEIIVNEYNNIISYKNSLVKNIDDNFLCKVRYLKNLELPNVETIGNRFLEWNKSMRQLDLPNVVIVGDRFCAGAETIDTVNMPKLEQAGDFFLGNDEALVSVVLNKLRKVGNCFLVNADKLEDISLKSLEEVGQDFICESKLYEIDLPNIKVLPYGFLKYGVNLTKVILPNVLECEDYVMTGCTNISYLYMPKVVKIGSAFMTHNKALTSVYFPHLNEVGSMCLSDNKLLISFYAPELTIIKDGFLLENDKEELKLTRKNNK